jgi:DNA-binding transcriptional LysR family regulator
VASAPSGDLVNLSTQQLQYLVAVSEASTWADAAAGLGVSPSALSQGLRQLERRLGMTLFDRDARRRTLLPTAAPVLAYARSVSAQTRDLSRWVAAATAGISGSLRVGMIDLAATAYFGSTLQRFGTMRPDVDLHLAVGPSGALLDDLLAGRLSMVVVVEPPVLTGELSITPLLEDELAVYGPASTAAQGRRVASSAGEWGPWVTFPQGSHTRRLVADRLASLGATFDVVAESHQPEVLRGMVALGMGWTVLPILQAETEPNPLVRARPEPMLTRRLVAARRQSSLADPLADALLGDLMATVAADYSG